MNTLAIHQYRQQVLCTWKGILTMTQFSSPFRSFCLLIAALLTGGFASGQLVLAQGTSSVRMPSNPGGQRMGVIDSQRPAGATYHYTIIGAVARSGAFHSNESSVSLEQLLNAAGGLSPNASPTLKVLRNQQIRFQILFDPRQPDPANRLQPGDVVIVTATGGVPSTIPVACLGLLDRPVVLPLDPTIQTVNELTHRLLQSPEAARMAAVVSPQGDIQGRLTPGTVVIFSPGSIDRYPLMQPGALPESLELKKFHLSSTAVPHAVPHTVIPVSEPSRTLSQPVTQTISEPTLELTLPGEAPEPASDLQSSMHSHSPPVLRVAAETPSLFLDSARLQHDSGAPSQHLFAAPEVDGVTVSRIVGTSAQLMPGEASEMPLVLAEQTMPLHEQSELSPGANGPLISPFSSDEMNHGLPAAMQAQSNRYASLFNDTETATGEATAEQTPAAGEVPASNQTKARSVFKLPSLIGGLSGLLAIIVAIGYVLSQLQSPSNIVMKAKPRTPTEPVVTLQAAAMAAPQTDAATESVAPTATPAPRSASMKSSIQDDVEAIVQRTVPLVEESVRIPGNWQLHGQVVGHRRIVLHQAHEEVVPVPHFAIKVDAASTQSGHRQNPSSERELRTRLKDAFRPTRQDVSDVTEDLAESPPTDRVPTENVANHDRIDRGSGSSRSGDATVTERTATAPALENPVLPELLQPAVPVQPSAPVPAPHLKSALRTGAAGPTEYDIVQPELSQSPARSPLERALRTLASEKSG